MNRCIRYLYFPFNRFLIFYFFFVSEDEEELDSDESSGKDWSELEEEAKRGLSQLCLMPIPPRQY